MDAESVMQTHAQSPQTLALKECPTCYTANVPISRVLFLQCGHHICIDCITKCASKCPTCRTRIVPGTPHRVYLGPDELVQAEDIAYVDARVASQSNATSYVDPKTHQTLLHQYEETCATVRSLLDELRELRQQLQIAETNLGANNSDLIEKNKAVERYKLAYKRKKEEIQQLQSAREADERRIQLLNVKIKALVKQKAKIKPRKSDPGDASLMIEDKPNEI